MPTFTRRPAFPQEVHRRLWATRGGRLVVIYLLVLAAATGVGLVALSGGQSRFAATTVTGESEPAKVTAVAEVRCAADPTGPACVRVSFALADGPNAGASSSFELSQAERPPRFAVGDRIRVLRNLVSGLDPALVRRLPLDATGEPPYAFLDFERRAPLGWLALAFAAIVIGLGRLAGARALVGLGASLAVVTQFVVPSILSGRPPLAVALVAASAVMFVTIALTHGLGVKSIAAMTGTSVILVLTALLSLGMVEAAHITGLASEEASLLGGSDRQLSLEGLVLAGMVIAALGVLDDVTVSQASTVLALRAADPTQSVRRLAARALSVGRDHLGATVNTLVLAYAGAALPTLLIFGTQQTSLLEAVNREVVSREIVGGLVGSIGLIAAVPVTTLVAARLARLLPPEGLAGDHAHVH